MESSILSEVDDTSILRTGSPRRYGCPLNWLPTSRLLPRAAGWSAATLCLDPIRTYRNRKALNLDGTEGLRRAPRPMKMGTTALPWRYDAPARRCDPAG